MGIPRRAISRLFKWVRSEISVDYKRCDAVNYRENRCIKQDNHLFCHEDAWRKLWW